MLLQTLMFHHEFLRDRIDQSLQSVAEDTATHQQYGKKHVMSAKSARMFQPCTSVASLFGISRNFLVLKVNEVFLLFERENAPRMNTDQGIGRHPKASLAN